MIKKLSRNRVLVVVVCIFAVSGLLIFFKSKKNDTARYFLSDVILENNQYKPLVTRGFIVNDLPIYYRWSAIYYPPQPPYKISLVMVELQDGADIREDFIKEIKTASDWADISRYNFNKKRFGK